MVKVVIITGASAGMGLTTAKHLAEKGFRVYGASRRSETGRERDGFTELQMDVCHEPSVEKAIEMVFEREGRIDALVNNAGIGLIGSMEDTSDAEARAVFDTNVFGLMNVSRAVLPHMRQAKKGTIINISSIAGKMGLPYRGIYSATKAAVLMITEATSSEVQAYGVRVCSILPGDFKTSINDNRQVVKAASRSVYKEQTTRLNNQVNHEVQHSGDPIAIAKKVCDILQSKQPAMHYKVAKPVQKLSAFLHDVLPGRWFERILMNHYKIK
ncbi:MAG: SDR family oxidoreductase [Cryomorphaceae bacterium]|nr:MAG: SDR family oxidoreductase [Cryomorphaceae bacterium]